MEESTVTEETTGTLQLYNLPEDVLLLITEYLDLKSLYNMYNTSREFRNIIIMPNIVKHFPMSMNSFATEGTLRLNFFKDLSNNLQSLNIRGVKNLTAKELLSVLPTLKSLKSLEVSHTPINILDLITVPELCPTLKDVSMNFHFGKDLETLSPEHLTQCQSLFGNFDKIHFTGSHYNLTEKKLPFYLLRNAKLSRLVYSVPDFFMRTLDSEFAENEELIVPSADSFFIYSMNYYGKEHSYYNLTCYPIVMSILKNDNYEIIVILKDKMDVRRTYASAVFTEFLSNNFGLKPIDIASCTDLSNNSAILAWNKHAIEFNERFFNKLKCHLKKYIPYSFNSPCKNALPKDYDCFHTNITDYKIKTNNHNERNFDWGFFNREMEELPLDASVLDYNEAFKNHKTIKLHISFNLNYNRKPIAFPPNSDFLSKITLLSLSALNFASKEIGEDFFHTIFKSCTNIETLNVEQPDRSNCAPNIASTIAMSGSIKNIYIREDRIDFENLFQSFSKCRTLENIHVADMQYIDCEPNNFADPDLVFKNCDNLYSIYLAAFTTEEIHKNKKQLFEETKIKYGKIHVNVILTLFKGATLNYCPSMDVLKLCPIKSV